jgi:hypothetical protein
MKKLLFWSVGALFFTIVAVFGMEKDGLRVEVVPKILSDGSAIMNTAVFTTPVDKEMALKATFKNTSMKDAPEGTIDYIVLVQRWAAEKGSRLSYTGTEKLPAMRFSDQVEVDIGSYHIGGHLHGSSDQHEDKLAAWKITVTQGEKKTEFSTPNFVGMSAGAKPAHSSKK